MTEQHVQLPIKPSPISPSDKLIYCALKKHGEKSFPSLKTVSNYLHVGINKIRDSIQHLVDNDYIKVHKEGRKNVYTFNPYKKFEMFSYEFLDKPELTFGIKAYIVALQQFMLKNGGFGKVEYSDAEIADKIGLSQQTVNRYNQSLVEQGLLTIQPNQNGNAAKMFNLIALGQAILFHQVAKNTEDIEDLKQENEKIKRELAEMKKETMLLKRVLTSKNRELAYYKDGDPYSDDESWLKTAN